MAEYLVYKIVRMIYDDLRAEFTGSHEIDIETAPIESGDKNILRQKALAIEGRNAVVLHADLILCTKLVVMAAEFDGTRTLGKGIPLFSMDARPCPATHPKEILTTEQYYAEDIRCQFFPVTVSVSNMPQYDLVMFMLKRLKEICAGNGFARRYGSVSSFAKLESSFILYYGNSGPNSSRTDRIT